MSADPWLEANNLYLAASLRWLRLRLQRLNPGRKATPSPAPSSGQRRSWFGRGAGTEPLLALPPQDPADAIRHAAEERTAAAAMDPPPALMLLAGRLGLTDFERDTLLLCAAMQFDPGIAELLTTAPGAAARAAQPQPLGFPTFAVAMQAFDEPSWDAQSPLPAAAPCPADRDQPRRRDAADREPASRRRADRQLHQGPQRGRRAVGSLATALNEPGPPQLSKSQSEVADAVLKRLRTSAGEAAVPAIQLLGADPVSKLAVARQVGDALNRRLHRIGLDALPAGKAELEEFARLWQREAVLLPLALYVDAETIDQAPAETSAALQRLLGRNRGLLFVARRDLPEGGGRSAGYAVEVARPTVSEQCEAWLGVLSPALAADEAARTAGLLAGQFDLNLPDIAYAARLAQSEEETAGTLRDRVWDACRALTRPRLDGLAQRLEPKADWDDLVLGDEAAGLLRQIAGQVRAPHPGLRGLGLRAADEPRARHQRAVRRRERHRQDHGRRGLANELRLDLYRIDLSAVVSKYIGETEKNLRRLFDARRGRRRDPVLRRGRRAVRQAQRGQGQPRPLRQHRDQLPAAADGGVLAAWRSSPPT